MKVAVIGAGPTGLTAALHLVKTSSDCQVDIFEAGPTVGGFSKSFYLFDHLVDLGPHRFFTQDSNIMQFWLDLADGHCHKVERKTSILYENHYIAYPITASDLLKALPLKTKSKIFSSFLKRGEHRANDGKNFSSTMRYRFGNVLYELFFKDYTERLWGVSDVDLSASLAYQRIGGFGLAHAVRHAMYNCFRKVEDSFMYPKEGCGQIWETAARRIQKRNGKLYLSTPVTTIERNGDGFTITSPMGAKKYDKVISTMPMSKFISSYSNSPRWLTEQVQKLRFRSSILIYVEVADKPHFADQWIYINSKNINSGRVTNFSNWGISNNQNKSTHILCLEYWCTSGDLFWQKTDAELSKIAITDLESLGHSSNLLKRTHIVRLPNTYPVITNESESLMNSFADELDTHHNLQTVGRGGAFKYNNQDHCIEMGLRAAKNILGEKSDIWSVNSQKSYLESDLVQNAIPPG